MERARQKRLRADMAARGKPAKQVKSDTREVDMEEIEEDRRDIQGWKSQEEYEYSAADL